MTVLAILEGSAFGAGVAMGTASLLSIGPNNLTLIREGASRGHVGIAATTVWTSRLTLLMLAFVFTDIISTKGLAVRPVLSWLGLLTLCWFALCSLRAYLRSGRNLNVTAVQREPITDCVRRVLTIFWLNPLTYLEMLFVPATVGSSFVMPICRALFIAGLITTATASCYGYAFGGRACAPVFRRRNMVRMFDLISFVILSLLSIALATGLLIQLR
jgi:L-lysine exporter family protein LysE/ArgO